jgi:hypothetical protein
MRANKNLLHSGCAKWLALGCLLTAVASVVLLGLFFYATARVGSAFWQQAEEWDVEQEPWEEASFDLPDGSGRVSLLRQNAHPFLAEYNRRLRFELEGRLPVTLDLPMNVGGRTLINVYLFAFDTSVDGIATSVLHLKDRWGDYVVDLDRLDLVSGADLQLAECTYLGRFDGRDGTLEFVPATASPEEELKIE